jgi:anti-anti-sigma factor
MPRTGGGLLFVDLREVRAMDRTGFATLAKAEREMVRDGGQLRVVNAQPAVARLLARVGRADLLDPPLPASA